MRIRFPRKPLNTSSSSVIFRVVLGIGLLGVGLSACEDSPQGSKSDAAQSSNANACPVYKGKNPSAEDALADARASVVAFNAIVQEHGQGLLDMALAPYKASGQSPPGDISLSSVQATFTAVVPTALPARQTRIVNTMPDGAFQKFSELQCSYSTSMAAGNDAKTLASQGGLPSENQTTPATQDYLNAYMKNRSAHPITTLLEAAQTYCTVPVLDQTSSAEMRKFYQDITPLMCQ